MAFVEERQPSPHAPLTIVESHDILNAYLMLLLMCFSVAQVVEVSRLLQWNTKASKTLWSKLQSALFLSNSITVHSKFTMQAYKASSPIYR